MIFKYDHLREEKKEVPLNEMIEFIHTEFTNITLELLDYNNEDYSAEFEIYF